MRRIIDISQTLRPGLPLWPGDTAFAMSVQWSIGPACPVNVSRLTLSTHSGSHADAPLHYDAAGKDAAAVALSPYIGPCVVIDARGAGETVEPKDIADVLPERVARVLIRTFDHFPMAHWPTTFKAIAPATIDFLAARGCVLIGVDAPSLDPETSKTMDAHGRVRAAGLAILEGLVLDHVTPGVYELIALPLKIENGDASPVRAVLREIRETV